MPKIESNSQPSLFDQPKGCKYCGNPNIGWHEECFDCWTKIIGEEHGQRTNTEIERKGNVL